MSLKDTYSTLINPETEVPANILELTGITQEELDTAPKFFELAEDLLSSSPETVSLSLTMLTSTSI